MSVSKIYFVVENVNSGSSLMRANQIRDELLNHYDNVYVVTTKDIDRTIRNALFVWVKEFDYILAKILKDNVHVYDVVDNFIYQHENVKNILNENLFQGLIVNNSFMVDDIRKNTTYGGQIFVIHHHWDPRLAKLEKTNQDELIYGYLGSVASLKHTDNFLHYGELIRKFPVQFIDSELGQNVTDLVRNEEDLPRTGGKIVYNPHGMEQIKVNFNCHLSIRENDTIVSKYKTTAKLATTSALGHNIITTYEHAVADILPETYPFILRDTDMASVTAMLDLVKKDYDGGGVLWNKGLFMMSDVRDELSIKRLIMKYVEMVESLI